MPDQRIVFIEHALSGEPMVAFLRHGQGDDTNRRIGKTSRHGSGFLRRDKYSGERTHGRQSLASAVAVGADIEPVLRRERVARRRTAQAHAEYAPPWISGEQRLRVAGQMGSRESADTEVDDAGC